jgi:hypothetical protein
MSHTVWLRGKLRADGFTDPWLNRRDLHRLNCAAQFRHALDMIMPGGCRQAVAALTGPWACRSC